jgi:hypothetical protein
MVAITCLCARPSSWDLIEWGEEVI